jgi:thiol:disulfide interchange protein DsbD
MRFPYTFPPLFHRAVFALAYASPACAADETAFEPVRAELVAEHAALVPGHTLSLGVRLRHAPHWHSYWINPGDSGLPTTLAWSLPAGYTAGEVGWPVPKRFDVGGLHNIGYEGDVLLPVALKVPADAVAGSNAPLAVTVKWLACREECIPGKATLSLELPVAREMPRPDARVAAAFTTARLAQPQASAWSGSAHDGGARIAVRLAGAGLPSMSARLDAFVVQRKVVGNAPPSIRRDGDALLIEAARSEYFTRAPVDLDLVVTTTDGPAPRGWHVRVPYAAGTAPAN